MALFFWFCVGLIVYTYILYPLLVVVWAYFFPKPSRFVNAYLPSVSMVVAAYNEEEVIKQKLENCLAIDYPADKIEFLFASDGSSDRTNEILVGAMQRPPRGIAPTCCQNVEAMPGLGQIAPKCGQNVGLRGIAPTGPPASRGISPTGPPASRGITPTAVKAFLYRERAGKLNVLNKLVPEAKGELLVFSDANTMYEADAVRKLVRHFADPTVGGVCGKLRLVNPNQNVGGEGEGLYWRYENVLKSSEGKIYAVIGANGAIYAIRRELFRPLPSQAVIMDDFLISLRVLEQGFRVIYEPEAVASEKTSPDMQGEFTRKVRIAAANFNGISYIKGLLNPLRGFVALALWSHKIVRWLVPFLALAALVTNLFLLKLGGIYVVTLALHLLLYAGAILGYLGDRLFRHSGPFMLFYYLVTMNLAIFLGFWRSMTRTQKMAWERVEH